MSDRQFEGRTAAEAAIKACEALGTTRAALKYRVVSETGEALERRVVIAVDAQAATQELQNLTQKATEFMGQMTALSKTFHDISQKIIGNI